MRYILLMIVVLYFVYKGIEFLLPSSWLEANPDLPLTLTIYIYIIFLAYFIIWKPIVKIIKGNSEVEFGKYKGEKWENVPENYLRWVIDNLDGAEKDAAIKELEKRTLK